MPPRIRTVLCQVAAAAIGISITITLGLFLDRNPVVELDPIKSSIYPNPALPGQTINITWHAIAHRNCSGIVIPRIIDSTGRIYEFTRSSTVYQDIMQPGDRTFTKTLTLPAVMAPGTARYQAVVIRWCNRVQELLWPMVDEPFPIPFEVEK